MIRKIKEFILKKNLDGYIIPKNDNYFTEYSKINNLSRVTNFTGSAGFALILKNKNYLFVDGRYTLQAKKQSGKNFTVLEVPYFLPKSLSNIFNFNIGFNPKLFTENTLEKYFDKKVNLIPAVFNFKEKVENVENSIFLLDDSISGESSISKINKVKNFMKKNNINYLYTSASENVNWLLNIRGKDLPNSPLANCKIIITYKGELFLSINLKKISSSIKKKN